MQISQYLIPISIIKETTLNIVDDSEVVTTFKKIKLFGITVYLFNEDFDHTENETEDYDTVGFK